MHNIEQLNATLAGRYAVDRQIGTGGMAIVYLAKDLRHNRDVAVKVLNPELAAVIGTERFLGEIDVTASLHHPHLLPLFDSGEADGLLYYVMPYIEGESLRDRLARERQLDVAEAVRFATAIGSALDYAHRHGVIHRDLKPENVLVHEDEPLVTDFGIALAVSKAGGPRITQSGLSLGTPHYMSPEQATGSDRIDARSDLYSLGAMLYEMLVGDPPHTGSTVQAVIARVIADKPASIRSSRDSVPPHVEAAVLRALSKLPADRFATAAEFSAALASPAVNASPQPDVVVGATRSLPGRVTLQSAAAWSAGLVAAGVLGAVATIALRKPVLPHAAQFAVALPDTATIPPVARAVAVSRDGAWLAMVGESSAGSKALRLRPTTEMKFETVRGTESAESPSFSPDGSQIMFASGGRLMKVPTKGGSVLTIADSASAQASWGDGDQVVFARGRALFVIPAGGGTARVVARPDSSHAQVALGWPEVLPGGERVLATVWTGKVTNDSAHLAVIDIKDGSVHDLGIRGTSPRFASGNMLFADVAGKLWAAPFSSVSGKLSGEPVLLAERISVDSTGGADFTASSGGLIVYSEAASVPARRISGAVGLRATSSLVITDSTGAARSASAQRDAFYMPRVSPDGTHIAVAVGAVSNSDGEIWIYDVASGALSPLTQDARVTRPEWDASGHRVAYRPIGWVTASFVSQPSDRSGAPVPIHGTESTLAFSWGTVGRYLAVERRVSATNDDIWIVPRSGSGHPIAVDTTAAYEALPRLSPNERWVAYLSNESGKDQVYVRPVPGPGARVPISIDGGEAPDWSRDGKSLYYVERGRLMAARIAETPAFAVTRRDTLIDLTADATKYLLESGLHMLNYDVFPHGGFVFLGNGVSTTKNRQNVIAMVDWTRHLRAHR